MIEITRDEDGIKVTVTDGFVKKTDDGTFHCPECGALVTYLVARLGHNVIQPVRSYQLLGCMHEFSTSEYYLHVIWGTVEGQAAVEYYIRPLPADRRYDPVVTALEKALWTRAGNSESSREIFHMYGGE